MNLLTLQRLTKDERPTVGVLRYEHHTLCFVIEDRFRLEKVKGDTRIPEGIYPLRWRTSGRWASYFRKLGFPGSLEICGIPHFSDVLLHVGNDKGDTEGCPLPNMTANLATRSGGRSKDACLALYQRVHETGGDWSIRVF